MSVMRNDGRGVAGRGRLDDVILWTPLVVKCMRAVRRWRLSGPPAAVIVKCSRSAILLAVAAAGIRTGGEVETGEEYGIFQAH